MKKLILILFLLALCVSAYSQQIKAVEPDGLLCTSDGIAYIPSTDAYGEWSWIFNNADQCVFGLLLQDSVFTYIGRKCYNFYELGGSLYFDKEQSNIISFISAVSDNIDYEIKITRDVSGLFTFYIRGGHYGWDSFTVLGSISNNAYTVSRYLVCDLDIGDQIRNLKINGELKHISEATVRSGSFTPTGVVADRVVASETATGKIKAKE